jgi:hypothetical protein
MGNDENLPAQCHTIIKSRKKKQAIENETM